jgi:hypothetical protein
MLINAAHEEARCPKSVAGDRSRKSPDTPRIANRMKVLLDECAIETIEAGQFVRPGGSQEAVRGENK